MNDAEKHPCETIGKKETEKAPKEAEKVEIAGVVPLKDVGNASLPPVYVLGHGRTLSRHGVEKTAMTFRDTDVDPEHSIGKPLYSVKSAKRPLTRGPKEHSERSLESISENGPDVTAVVHSSNFSKNDHNVEDAVREYPNSPTDEKSDEGIKLRHEVHIVHVRALASEKKSEKNGTPCPPNETETLPAPIPHDTE